MSEKLEPEEVTEIMNVALTIGIGINTGDAIIGNMGSADRFDYTAIGDAVNVGARTESACKEAGADLLITKATMSNCNNKFKELKPIKVKGKSKPLEIYTIK